MARAKRICVVVASRANYGRCASLLSAIICHPNLKLRLIVSASALLPRYGDALAHIRSEGITVDYELPCVIEGTTGTTMAMTTGVALTVLAPALQRIAPDCVVTIADRHETLATAIAASYSGIPLAHLQGGERSGSIDDRVRAAVTALADFHFPASVESVRRLVDAGVPPARIHYCGCPGLDVRLPRKVEVQGAVLVVYHPDTSSADCVREIDTIAAAVKRAADGRPIVWLWPNVDAGSDELVKRIKRSAGERVDLYRGFSPEAYAGILHDAAVAVGNSSSFIREGALFGTPAVIVGSRQRGREHGANAVFVSDRRTLFDAITQQIAHGRYASDIRFGDGRAGARIAQRLCEVLQ